LCLIGTALFLFKANEFNFLEKLLITLLIAITVVNCGVLFEGKRWVRWTELARIIIFPGLILTYNYANLTPLLIGIASLYFISSLIWFLSIVKNDKNIKS
jgi:hypothetical protein